MNALGMRGEVSSEQTNPEGHMTNATPDLGPRDMRHGLSILLFRKLAPSASRHLLFLGFSSKLWGCALWNEAGPVCYFARQSWQPESQTSRPF